VCQCLGIFALGHPTVDVSVVGVIRRGIWSGLRLVGKYLQTMPRPATGTNFLDTSIINRILTVLNRLLNHFYLDDN